MKKILPILALALTLSAAAQQPRKAEPQKVTKANYELASRFSQKRVGQLVYSTRITPNWFANSDRFWYSWKTAQGTKYYLVDPATGKKSEIFDMDKLAMQITEITRDPYDAQHLPLQLQLKDDKYFQFDITSKTEKKDTSAKKKGRTEYVKYRFYYDIATKKLTWDTDEHTRKYPAWANVSPDGTKGVYVKNYNLYLMDSTSLRKAAKDEKDSTIVEKRLTTDGTAEFSWNANSYSGDSQTDTTKRSPASISWSPDGKHFAIVRWDMSKIKPLWVINSVTEPRPTLETYKYQMPGEPGPTPYLYVMDTEGNKQAVRIIAFKDQDFDILSAPRTQKDSYKEFRGGRWMGDNKHFWVSRVSRDLKRLDLCRVDVGSDSTKTIVSERMNTYVESRSPRFLPDGSFVWWSERNGWANLYLYGPDGTLKRNLTEGAFHVDDVLAVGDGYLLVAACGVNKEENPYQMHTFRVPLAGGPMQQLDMDDMDVKAVAPDDGKYFVANYSRVDCKPAAALISAAGKRTDLEEADFSQLFAAGYKFPERFVVKAADGITDLHGAIYKPFDFDSTKRLLVQRHDPHRPARPDRHDRHHRGQPRRPPEPFQVVSQLRLRQPPRLWPGGPEIRHPAAGDAA